MAQQVTGAQRYGWELLNALDDLLSYDKAPVVEVLVPQSVTAVPPYKALRVRKVGRLSGHIWEQLELPWSCRGALLFTPSGGAPLLHREHIITIHDAAVFAAPQGYSFRFRNWYRFLYTVLGRSSRRVLTVSYFSKHELARAGRIRADKIYVAYLGCEHIRRVVPDDSILQRFGLEANSYALAVSSRNPNKNFHSIVRAISELNAQNIRLVIAGGINGHVFGGDTALPGSVIQLGYVNDSELRSLYENAACFVFPSLYEGFGLPPLEALALGCSVVLSNRASLPEVFQDIALFCDPLAPKNIAEQVARAIRGGVHSREDNIQFASKFTWKECAQLTWQVLYQAACECES